MLYLNGTSVFTKFCSITQAIGMTLTQGHISEVKVTAYIAKNCVQGSKAVSFTGKCVFGSY